MVDAKQNNHPQQSNGSTKPQHARKASLKQNTPNSAVSRPANGLSTAINGATSAPLTPSLYTPTPASQIPTKSSLPNPQLSQPVWPPVAASTPGSSGGAGPATALPIGDMLSTLAPGTSAAIAERERQREAEAAYLLNWKRPRTKEDTERQQATRNRMKQLLQSDRKTVHQPDVETPFHDAVDVVRRLLPYHIFNHPQAELEYAVSANAKGKGKEIDLPARLQAIALENEETEMALELHQQTRALKEQYRKIRTREAEKNATNDALYWLTRATLESDKELNTRLSTQLREAQLAKDRQDREKRGIGTTASQPAPATNANAYQQQQQQQRLPYSYAAYSTPTNVSYPNFAAYANSPAYQAYYQQYAAAMAGARLPYGTTTYPYGYLAPAAQYPPPPSTMSAGSSTAATTPMNGTPVLPPNNTNPAPVPPTPTSGPPNTALPLSLPIAALDVLRAAGIVPIPVQNLPPSTSPQPAVILLGMSPDGSVANLTINLSLLEPEKRGQLGAVLQGLVKPAVAA